MVMAAVSGGLGAITTAVSKQTHRIRAARPAPPASAVAVVSQAKTTKAAKLAMKQAKNERLYDLLTQPEVLGWLMTIGGILAVQNIPFHPNKAVNEMLQGTATSATVIMGMGHAGVGDLTTSIIAGLTGVASLMGGVDLPDFSLLEALPGLTVEETEEVARKSILQSLPMGLGYLFR